MLREYVAPKIFDKQLQDYSIDSRSVGAAKLFFCHFTQNALRPAPALMEKSQMRTQFIGDAFKRGARLSRT